jgi:hypothetical protein
MPNTEHGVPESGTSFPEFDGSYGPQAPRIKRERIRQVLLPRETISFIAKPSEAFPQGSISVSTNVQHTNTELCIDTIRNPKFRGPRELISDDGGDLTIRRSWWRPGNAYISSDWQGNTRTQGSLWLNFYGEFHDGFSTSDDLPPAIDYEEIAALGPSAWNSFKPAKPMVQIGVLLYELRELPRLLYTYVGELKNIADYFLAVQYGWTPILNDVLRMVKVYQKVSQRIDFLIANSGKPVRRKGRLSSTSDSALLWEETGLRMRNTAPDLGKPSLTDSWRQSSRYTITRERWFSAEFLFWIDDIRLPNTRAHIGAGLVGLRITPADVWDALPWTWLIDWFANVGDVLHNLEDNVADRQVSRYAYVMGKTIREYSQHTTDGYFSTGLSHLFETKVRRKVDPFGLTPEVELSPLQIAILGALALQRI